MNHSEKLSTILVASLIVMALIVTCFPQGVANMMTGTTRTVSGCQTVTTTSSGTTTITTTKVICRTYTGQLIMGYIGCSDTWMSIDGYYQQPNNIGLFWGSLSLWPRQVALQRHLFRSCIVEMRHDRVARRRDVRIHHRRRRHGFLARGIRPRGNPGPLRCR